MTSVCCLFAIPLLDAGRIISMLRLTDTEGIAHTQLSVSLLSERIDTL